MTRSSQGKGAGRWVGKSLSKNSCPSWRLYEESGFFCVMCDSKQKVALKACFLSLRGSDLRSKTGSARRSHCRRNGHDLKIRSLLLPAVTFWAHSVQQRATRPVCVCVCVIVCEFFRLQCAPPPPDFRHRSAKRERESIYAQQLATRSVIQSRCDRPRPLSVGTVCRAFEASLTLPGQPTWLATLHRHLPLDTKSTYALRIVTPSI